VRDVAVVSFARTEPGLQGVQETDTQMLFPVINEALDSAGLERKDIGFTVSASCDYLSGAPFAFVQTLEATGAWPPISESHVEMDGAWALYEAWVRLQHGDIDTALVFAAGMSTRGNMREVLTVQLDPYYLMPLWVDPHSLAALQARALIDANKATEDDFASIAQRLGTTGDAYVVEPLRERDVPTYADGAACVILAAGDRAREVCSRPAWIAGIDHRSEPHYPGVRDLSVSPSARIAGEQAGVDKAKVDVAELCAQYTPEEILLREALGLDDGVDVNPSGGALRSNPLMVAGLVRIGEAAKKIHERSADRVVGHASAGPCLQQNLVCVMEGDR
jgi:acetyl-CoA acetyltransferase